MKTFVQFWKQSFIPQWHNQLRERVWRFFILTPVTSFFLMLFVAAGSDFAEKISWTVCLLGGLLAGVAVALPRQ